MTLTAITPALPKCNDCSSSLKMQEFTAKDDMILFCPNCGATFNWDGMKDQITLTIDNFVDYDNAKICEDNRKYLLINRMLEEKQYSLVTYLSNKNKENYIKE